MSDRRALDRRILSLALPAAGSALVLLLYRAVDMAWVKFLGAEAVAGLSVSTNTVWLFGGVSALVSMGLGALVARYVGAGRPDAARYVAGQGLRWAAVLGAATAALGWVGSPLVFAVAGADPGVAEAGIPYTRIYWAGGVAMLVQNAGDAVFRAHGNTRVPFGIAATSLGANAVLDPIFIFHRVGPLPGLGLGTGGAAIATVLSAALGAGLMVGALHRRRLLGRLRPSDDVLRLAATTSLGRPGAVGLDLAVGRRVMRVGLPVLASSVLFNGIYLVLQSIADRAAGPAGQAALGIGWQGEGLAFVACLGWSAAASSLVGRHLGAGQPREAARAAWRASLQCAALCGAWGVALFAFDREIAGIFTRDPAVLEHAASYFRIVALCLAPQAVEIVLEGAFGGAGHTVPPMVISVVATAMRIPLAAWMAFDLGLGVDGLWWTIMATATLRGVACAAWFRRGTWTTRAV